MGYPCIQPGDTQLWLGNSGMRGFKKKSKTQVVNVSRRCEMFVWTTLGVLALACLALLWKGRRLISSGIVGDTLDSNYDQFVFAVIVSHVLIQVIWGMIAICTFMTGSSIPIIFFFAPAITFLWAKEVRRMIGVSQSNKSIR